MIAQFPHIQSNLFAVVLSPTANCDLHGARFLDSRESATSRNSRVPGGWCWIDLVAAFLPSTTPKLVTFIGIGTSSNHEKSSLLSTTVVCKLHPSSFPLEGRNKTRHHSQKMRNSNKSRPASNSCIGPPRPPIPSHRNILFPFGPSVAGSRPRKICKNQLTKITTPSRVGRSQQNGPSGAEVAAGIQ